MSQDVFRALLSRPATQAGPASRSSAPAAQAPAAAKARRTFKPHKVSSSSSSSAAGSAGASGAPAFRDRARERREDPKSTAVEEEISLYTRVGYDESKHLGGDLSRTHLVKGLDYLLLEKLRRGEGGEEGDGDGDGDAALEAALEGGGGNGGEQDQHGSTHHPEESLGAWAAGIVAVALTVHSARASKKSDAAPTTLPLVEQLARLRVEQRKPGRFAYGCLTYAFPLDTGLDDWEAPLSLWSSSSGGSRSGGGQLLLPGTLDDALYNTVVSTLHPRGGGRRPSLRTIASAPSTAAAAAGKVANVPALSTSRPSPPSASASSSIKPALKVTMLPGTLPLQPPPQPVKKVGFEEEKEVAKPKEIKEEEKAGEEEEDDEDIFGGVGKYVPPEASASSSSSSSSAAAAPINAPPLQKASTYRPLPPIHLRLVQTSTTTPLEESLLDEWDAVEKSETIAEERARLEAEARLEASKAAQAAMASKGGGGGAMAGAAPAKDTLKGGIGGGIQEGDALGSYEVQGWENPKEGAYKSEAWGVGGGQEEEEEEEELEAGVRRGGGGGKKSAPAPPAAFKRGRGDNTTDFSELGGASWKGVGVGAGGAPSQRGHKSLRVDEWSAGAATRGGEGFESEKERKRKEAEAQNRLAQLIDLKKRTG